MTCDMVLRVMTTSLNHREAILKIRVQTGLRLENNHPRQEEEGFELKKRNLMTLWKSPSLTDSVDAYQNQEP